MSKYLEFDETWERDRANKTKRLKSKEIIGNLR